MKILYHRHFLKDYKKAPQKVKTRFKKRLSLFVENPFHPMLSNHALKGKMRKYRSINITGDYRALYKAIDESTIEFVLLDTNHNLYGG
jgi:addiction module RelE/StbE family toxin